MARYWSWRICTYYYFYFNLLLLNLPHTVFNFQAADLLKHPHLQPYILKLHLNFNGPRRNTLQPRWSDYTYEKKTTFIEPEPRTVHPHNEKRRSFSSNRALNPSISEHDQYSSYSQSSTRKLSIGSVEEYIHTEKLVAAKTSIAVRTPRLTPVKPSASTPRRHIPSPKIIRPSSDRDVVRPLLI